MKLTLAQVFALSLLALTATLALLFYIVYQGSLQTILESSERSRESASRELGVRVSGLLAKAPAAVQGFQLVLNRGLIDARDPVAIEASLFTSLLANPDIGEITLTYGRKTGDGPDGEALLAPAPRGQLSVWRTPGALGDDEFWSRHVHQEQGGFVSDRRALRGKQNFRDQPWSREPGPPMPDPTLHATFTTPASRTFYGQLLWSDLHWSQLDAMLPEARRRVEVSVQQVVTDASGAFVGVLRVGLLTGQLFHAVTMGGRADAERVFICDAEGRLITRGEPGDTLADSGTDLRVPPAQIPEPFTTALASPALHQISGKIATASGHFRLGRVDFLTTFHALPDTQDWIVGILVPRAFYLGRLSAMRTQLLLLMLGLMLVLLLAGLFIIQAVHRAQRQVLRESTRMNAFEFSPTPVAAPFRDVAEVLESLEQAKTAMRAMGKYVPVDLVRRLYQAKREPALGGQETELSIMFTDIQRFTTLAEQLAPNELAAALGRYLEVMARVIQQETRGTIDKYIGDAIMAIWNAPEPVPDHARMACLAALRCRQAGQELATTPGWRGLPPFVTRFGLHCDSALVGHFGAPDRMNYTAIGDAVNLASRLESLNKQYGTTIIASEKIATAAGASFTFRLLDRVAVKGKSQAIRIYELLGRDGEPGVSPATVVAYENALAAYMRRDFHAALELLAPQPHDPPSIVLLQRCREYLRQPPPADWGGIYIATNK